MARPARCDCGYDLRGIDSPRCPECGAPVVWCALRFFDFSSFKDAAMVLERAGVGSRMARTGEGAFAVPGFGGTPPVYEISIAQLDLDRAGEALAPHGIAIQLPIVDRAEPWCPSCGTELTEDAVCRSCLAAYAWVDSGDSGAPLTSAPPPGAPIRLPWIMGVTGLAALLLTPMILAALGGGGRHSMLVPLLAWIVLYAAARVALASRRGD